MEPAIDLREQHFQRMGRHLWLDFTERLTRANIPAYEIFSEIVLPLIRASNTKELAEPAHNQLKVEIAAQLDGAEVHKGDGYVVINILNYNRLRQLSAV
jgi:hypothetical protein